MKKLPYSEGTIFLVPLRNGGFARGVVVRMNNEGKVLFGYFFGPRFESPQNVPLNDINPNAAILCVRFGDLGLINGEWPVCGKVLNWDRTKWPMPDFIRKDLLSKKTWLVRYSDMDPNSIDEEIIIEGVSNLPPDSLAGYGAIEIKLSQLLS